MTMKNKTLKDLSELGKLDEQLNIDVLVNHNIFEATYLFQNNYFEDCAEIVASTLKKAIKAELFNQLDTLLSLKSQLISLGIMTEQQSDATNLMTLKTKERLINLQQYECLNLQLNMLINNHGGPNSQINKFKQILTNPLLQNESSAISTKAKCIFYGMLGYLNAKLGEYAAAQKYYKKLLQTYECDLYFTLETPKDLIIIYSNLVNMNIGMRDFEEALTYIEQLKNLPQKYDCFAEESIQPDLMLRTLTQEIMIYSRQKKYYKVIEKVPAIKAYLGETNNLFKLTYQDLVVSYIAGAYQALDQKDMAITWFTLLEKYEHQELGTNNKVIGRLKKMLLLIDKKDQRGLAKAFGETTAFYKKYHIKGKYEYLFLMMIKNITQNNLNSAKIAPIFNEYLPLLESFIEPNTKDDDYRMFIVHWLKNKITSTQSLLASN